MALPRFDDLPALDLPRGVRVRNFRPGDAREWDRIVGAAFGWTEPEGGFFNARMRQDTCFRPERVLFLVRRGRPVATTSAWWDPDQPESVGTIHYVAVHPEAAGKGLGKWAVLAALHRMREEGHSAARLLTDDHRLPAIKTYLDLGFVPEVPDEETGARWRKVFQALGRPQLARRLARKRPSALPEMRVVPPNMREDVSYDYKPLLRTNPARIPKGRSHSGNPVFLADEWLYKPSAYGSVRCHPAHVRAGSAVRGTVRFEYRVGTTSLGPGASVCWQVRGQHPLGFVLQCSACASRPVLSGTRQSQIPALASLTSSIAWETSTATIS